MESVNLHSMMVPPTCAPEDKTQTQIMVEILQTVSRIEGMILAKGNEAKHEDISQQLVGAPIVNSAQLDFPPSLY